MGLNSLSAALQWFAASHAEASSARSLNVPVNLCDASLATGWNCLCHHLGYIIIQQPQTFAIAAFYWK